MWIFRDGKKLSSEKIEEELQGLIDCYNNCLNKQLEDKDSAIYKIFFIWKTVGRFYNPKLGQNRAW